MRHRTSENTALGQRAVSLRGLARLAVFTLALATVGSLLPGQAEAQSGDRALIYAPDAGMRGRDYSTLRTGLVQGGAAAVDTVGTIGSLTNYALVLVMVPRAGIPAGDQTALVNFYNAGGAIIGIGEHSGFHQQANDAINALAAASGASVRIINGQIDCGCGTIPAANIVDPELRAGVTTALAFGCYSQVNNGVLNVRGPSADFIRTDDRFMVNADVNFWDTSCASGNVQNTIFYANLWDRLTVPPPPTAEAGGPYNVNEGGSITLQGSGTGDTIAFAWDFDSDGQFDDATGATPTFPGLDGNATVTVRLRVTDRTNQTAIDTATVTVNNLNPTITAATIPNGNESQALTFSATASDPAGNLDPLTFVWDFGDGTPTQNGASVSHTFRDDGAFRVRVTVTDGDGGSTFQEREVTIGNVPPSLGAIAGDATRNEGQAGAWRSALNKANFDTVNFVIVWGDGSPNETGTVGSGTTAALINRSHTYTDNGTFTITFRATDDDGSTAQQTFDVTVNNVAPEITGMTAAPPTGPEGTTFDFEGTATDDGDDTLTFTWDFGDGTPPATGPNPSHTYPDAGTYTVTLTVTDDDGGTDTQTIVVVVTNSPPVIGSLTGDQSGDEGDVFSYEATASDAGGGALTFTWNFGDGTDPVVGQGLTSVSHTYRQSGDFTLSLTVTDEDGGSVTRTLDVVVDNVAPTITDLTAPEEGNEGASLNFSAAASDPGDDTLTFTWNFGVGAPVEGREVSFTYPDNGNFFIRLTVTDGDGGEATRAVAIAIANVNPLIESLDGDFTGDQGETFSYQAEASDPGDDTLTYTWDFGDGTPPRQGVDLEDVDHIYSASGTFTLTLTVNDEDGGVTNVTRTVNVGGQAPSIIELDGDTDGDEGSAFAFSALATDPGGDAITYTWSFGDGSPDASGVNLTDVEHTYAEDGSYTLTLTVNDADGESTATLTIAVANVAPTIQEVAAPSEGQEGLPLAVAAVATDPAGRFDPLTFRWDFGDGSDPVAGATATHTYAQEGDYTLTLTVTDDEGASSTFTQDIEIVNVAPQIAQFAVPNNGEEAQRLTFTALAQDPGDDNLTYTWTFGDNSDPISGADETNVSHTYADDGTFTVTLRVSDGATFTEVSQDIEVRNIAPTIVTLDGDTEGGENTTFSFEATATDPAGDNDPLTYTWNFGDGSPEQSAGDLTEIDHVYADAGLFNLRLTVSDGDGGVTSRTLIINVGNQAPVIETLDGDEEGNEGQSLSFEASASDGGNDPLTFTWNFGDNTPVLSGADLTEVQHTWQDNGEFTVTLTVSDGSDATVDTFDVTINNVAPTIETFEVPEDGVEGVRLAMSGAASDPAGQFDPLTFVWDFGDGSDTATGLQVEHAYADNGQFTVTLTVSDDDGGTTTETTEITIANANPVIAGLTGPDEVDEGSEAEFFVVATDVADDTLSYSWVFEDGPTFEGDDVTEVRHTYPDDGVFTLTLTVTDEDGGITVVERTLTVRNVSPVIIALTGDFSGAEGDTFGFQAEAQDPGADELTFVWDFGDGDDEQPSVEQGVDLTNVNHVYTEAGAYTLTLTVLDGDGGLINITRTVNVDTAAPTITEVVNPVGGDEGETLSFSAQAIDPTNQTLTFTWDFGDGSDPQEGESLTEVEHTYADNGTYLVTLTVTDPDGESAVATQGIVIDNVAPTIDDLTTGLFAESAPGDASAQASDPAGINDPLTYTWNWGDGTEADVDVDLTEASHAYAQSGTYTLTLTVTDDDGGRAVQTATIVVGDEPPQLVDVLGPLTGNEGETLEYTVDAIDVGGDNLTYTWQVSGSDAVDTGGLPAFSHTFTDNGTFELTVTATDEEGQTASRTVEVVIANLPPEIASISGRLLADEGQLLDYFGLATDPAGVNDPLTYTWDFGDGSEPQAGIDLTNVEHTYADGPETLTLTLTVTDDDGGSTSQTLEVVIENVAPAIVSQPPAIATFGATYSYTPEVDDPGDDTQTFELLEGPEGMEMDDEGNITWDMTQEQFNDGGPFIASIRVCDEDGDCDEQQWEIGTSFEDNDLDGVPDECERLFGLDPTDPLDGDLDPDEDGLTNRIECLQGTDPGVFNGPTAPGILSPEIDARVADLQPDLVATNATDPDDDVLTYGFEIFADEELTTLVAAIEDVPEDVDTTLASLVDAGVTLDDNTRYYWRVQAFDPFIGGPFSETGNFLVDLENEPPTVPNLISPEGSTDTLTPALTLDPSEDPEGDAIVYVYEVYDDEDLTELVMTFDSDQTAAVVIEPLVEDNFYFWRAAARDELGAQSEFADALPFHVNTDNRLPLPPVIISPEEGEVVEVLPVSVIWEQAVDEDGDPVTYELQIAGDEAFSEVIFERAEIPMGDEETVSVEIEAQLEEDSTYFARVRAFDLEGPGAFDTTFFVINTENGPAEAPRPISPDLGQDSGGGVLVFDEPEDVRFDMVFENAIDPDNDVLTYTIEVYSDENLTNLVHTIEDIDEDESGNTTIDARDFPGERGLTTYFWIVFATDDEGLDGARSDKASFNVIVPVIGDVAGSSCGCETPGKPVDVPGIPMALLAVLVVGVLVRRR